MLTQKIEKMIDDSSNFLSNSYYSFIFNYIISFFSENLFLLIERNPYIPGIKKNDVLNVVYINFFQGYIIFKLILSKQYCKVLLKLHCVDGVVDYSSKLETLPTEEIVICHLCKQIKGPEI